MKRFNKNVKEGTTVTIDGQDYRVRSVEPGRRLIQVFGLVGMFQSGHISKFSNSGEFNNEIKSVKCECGMSFPKNLMVGNKCYLCVIQQWPPKTIWQYRKYEKAVSIRLGLNSPLTVAQSLQIVKIVGLDNLALIQDVVDGKIVSHKPSATFRQRLIDKLGEDS